MDLQHWLGEALASVERWQAPYGPFDAARRPRGDRRPVGCRRSPTSTSGCTDNYPFFHPRYAGQMLKPPHPAAVVGYLAAMLINPNNHALDGGPATVRDGEARSWPSWPRCSASATHLGHLTSSGTIANLEALFVARELHPGRGVAYSAEAHYTHGRMCGVLGVPGHRGRRSTARAGWTSTRWSELLAGGRDRHGRRHRRHDRARRRRPGARGRWRWRAAHGVRVHVDAAYGGFFTLLAGTDGPAGLDPAPWRAIAACDSVVVDPHKHGLQPYGCGAVLFRDPAGRPALPARLAVHLLHLRRAAPGRDQPGVLAGRRGGRRAVAHLPAAAADAPDGLGAGARGRPAGGAATGPN